MESLAVKTSNSSTEWYTPGWLVEHARTVMGSIDIDPASTREVNERLVHAERFLDSVDDGLDIRWEGNVFLNPPSRCGPDLPVCLNKRSCSCKLTYQFMSRGFEEFYDGEVTNLFYIGFNLEQLKYLSNIHCDPDHVRICLLRNRVRYLTQEFVPGPAPPHSSFVLLLTEGMRERTTFDGIFSELGRIHTIL